MDYNCQLINNPLKHRLRWLSPTRLPSTCRVGPFHVAPGATSPSWHPMWPRQPWPPANAPWLAWWVPDGHGSAMSKVHTHTHPWDSLRHWVFILIEINWVYWCMLLKSNSDTFCFFHGSSISVERPWAFQRDLLSLHTIRPDCIQSGKAIRFSILVEARLMHPGALPGSHVSPKPEMQNPENVQGTYK